MKKLKKTIALCLICCFAANAAYAGGGLTGGATEITQLLNNSELVAQVAQLAAGTVYEAERARSDLSNKRIEAFFKR